MLMPLQNIHSNFVYMRGGPLVRKQGVAREGYASPRWFEYTQGDFRFSWGGRKLGGVASPTIANTQGDFRVYSGGRKLGGVASPDYTQGWGGRKLGGQLRSNQRGGEILKPIFF